MRLLNRLSFRTSILLCFIVLVVIPFVLIFSFTYRYFYTYTYQSTVANQSSKLMLAQSQIDQICENYKNHSMVFYYENYDDVILNDQQEDRFYIESKLENMIPASPGLVSLLVKTEKGEAYTGGRGIAEINKGVNLYTDQLKKNNGRVFFAPIQAFDFLFGRKSEQLIPVGRTIYDNERNSLGELWLFYRTGQLEKAINNADLLEGTINILIASNGEVAYSPAIAAAEADKLVQEIDLVQLAADKSGGVTLFGKEAIAVCNQYGDSQYMLLSILPESYITREVQWIRHIFLLFLGVFLIFIMLMVRMLQNQVFEPITKILYAADHFAEGDLSVRLAHNESNEMGKIKVHFNHMLDSIVKLMQENKQEEREKNVFKMEALMMQMSPHFIYNSLNTIKWMAAINRQEQIQKQVESLIKIFMTMSKKTDENNTIRDEMDLLRNYANIQKARYMNFELFINAEEDTMDLNIKRFLLQPVMENAIVHGIANTSKAGIIHLTVTRDVNLHITISDNGNGFDCDRPSAGKEKNRVGELKKIGLENVRQIIKLEYGNEYGITVESREGTGTRVVYLLPCQEIRREEQTNDKGSYH